MSLFSRLSLGLFRPSGSQENGDVAREAAHWNEIEKRAQAGERLFWLNHPRVAYHYQKKALVDGKPWREWVVEQLGGPANCALELGCGNGAALAENIRWRVAERGVGLDLEASRFQQENGTNPALEFLAGDVNSIELEENRYDLIYALQSFHHFEELGAIMRQVRKALTPCGFFVLDEFVGPSRFQWTDKQLTVTSQILGLLPKHLRMYSHGMEKRAEGRSTPEQVIAVCPSEAIRSAEIVEEFYKNFEVVRHCQLGGTIQHLLYSGIIHNFPDGEEAVDHLVDCIDGIETMMIEHKVLPSDFALLIGRK